MGVRETVNQRPGIVIACAAAVIVIALVVALMPSSATPSKGAAAQDWYTIDDGKSWFADDAGKFPPYEYKGKTAYRCRVWTCDDGKTKFVSHLERFTAEAKRKLETTPPQDAGSSLESRMIEVKRPLTGDQGWVSIRSPRAESIVTPKCASGQQDNLRPILPE
jgi:hypothetical protein